MSPLQRKCLCSTAIPIALGFGFAAVPGPGMGFTAVAHAQSANPCSPNPCAPCGAAPAGATDCGVPRLQEAQANPCAATSPCAAAAKPCNPCAVKKKPCAAAANPCSAQKPCAAANPSAAKKKSPSSATPNPCAAKNPSAAKNPCNPCRPCEAAAVPDVTPEELRAVYDCLQGYMRTVYGDGWQTGTHFANDGAVRLQHVAHSASGLPETKSFLDWKNFALAPYTSQTHGNRFVVNHANDIAEEPYGKYENIGTMPPGGIIAKPSFTISPNGNAQLGPLFLMEKMEAVWHPASENWRYTMVMLDGTVAGRTHGPNAEAVEFCVGCHASVADAQDSLFFIPEETRGK